MVAGVTASGLIEAFRAIVRAGRGFKQEEQRSAAALLAFLDHAGEQRLGQLACGLAVDPSVVSRQVVGLVRDGLVKRRPDPEDGRAGLLSLTDEGVDWLRGHRDKEAQRLLAALDRWSEDDAATLLSLLRRLEDDVRALSTQESPRAH
ncbi:DNA-binding transcriptional regulator, MarR family [Actinokineospora terrae]|uniref:DNA-binding transcriptional regulator, MarR family n=1 Tax=Actinokineospora terrae TaxID=155974 RepID=A0A1H9WEL5_9PSEU|nr:DNA-binding transcriptional regulator, MarR family [Actinokineospora terrae]